MDLAHASIDDPNASESPGAGQKQVVRQLRESRQLRLPEDNPDSPSYLRDKTPLRKGQISTASFRLEFYRAPSLPMLVGDDVFTKGIVQGIEAGLFVYRSGDLLWGKVDPSASIKIDENSYVYTTEFAQDNDIWPPKPKPDPGLGNDIGTEGRGSEDGRGASDGTASTGGGAPGDPGGGGTPGSTKTLPLTTFQAEGSLKEALNRVWEQAHTAKVQKLASLEIKLYNDSDAFTLMGHVRQIRGATVDVTFEGDYATATGSTFGFEFQGRVNDAATIKDFLAAQMRASREKNLHATYTIEFSDGLDLTGDEPATLTERLCKMGTGAAHVSAKAEGVR